MQVDLGTLSITAVSIGFIHCLCGPDHYVPFVAMSRVGPWSLRKTLWITTLCGLGHVASSALLGLLAAVVGFTVFKLDRLESIEAWRGDLAAWLLLGFGVAYTIWGLRRGWLHKHQHQHGHLHPDELVEGPAEGLRDPSADGSDSAPRSAAWREGVGRWTPWALFTVFVFGPCEPLIPLLIYPAAAGSMWDVLVVTLLFGLSTLVTMLAIVALMYQGLWKISGESLHRYAHAWAGLAITVCGAAILFGL